jgi:allantoicase
VILRLARTGEVRKIEIDTNYFKGNYPDRCSVESAYLPANIPADLPADNLPESWESAKIVWQTLLPEQKLQAAHQHFFEAELQAVGAVTHLRVNIFPDGGLSRFRVFGIKAD